MKLKSIVLGWMVMVGTLAGATANQVVGTNSVPRNLLLFGKPLVWVGDKSPTDAETLALKEILAHQIPGNSVKIEDFLRKETGSPWAPAVLTYYALSSRQAGRHTKALDLWEQAWLATRGYQGGAGKDIGDFTLAHWSSLLASLGRSEKLAEIFAETKGRKISSGYAALFQQAKDGYGIMRDHPGMAYRCGTFALANVARVLNGGKTPRLSLLSEPSPTNGFSMTELVRLAAKDKLPMVAVERPAGDTNLVAPAVIHWRQNHYAAVLRVTNGMCLVSDATSGQRAWLPVESVNQEVSGAFMVPSDKIPATWIKLEKEATDKVRGMGQPNSIDDWRDEGGSTPRVPCEGMPGWWVTEPYINLWVSDEPLYYNTSQGRLSFQILHKNRDSALTIPERAAWPIDYSTGRFLNRTLAERYDVGNNYNQGSLDANWHFNWVSSIVFYNPTYPIPPSPIPYPPPPQTNYHDWTAHVYLPEGGVRVYDNEVSTPNSDLERRSMERLVPLGGGSPSLPANAPTENSAGEIWPDDNTNGFALIRPDGSRLIYNINPRSSQAIGNDANSYRWNSQSEVFLSKRVAPNGMVTKYVYEHANFTITNVTPNVTHYGLYRLKYVIDVDGRTNRFKYPNMQVNGYSYSYFSYFPVEIESPYGSKVKFGYDSNSRLTNVVDAAGLTNSFKYLDVPGSSTNTGWLSYFETPYGRTLFHYYTTSESGQGNMGGHDSVTRLITATHPDQAKEMFVFRYETSTSIIPAGMTTSTAPEVPAWINDSAILDNGTTNAPSPALRPGLNFRNSFYWGRRQFAALPADEQPEPDVPLNEGGYYYPYGPFPSRATNYAVARWKHWLDGSADQTTTSTILSDSLALERTPSPDRQQSGRTVWYGYADKLSSYQIGDSRTPSFIAERLPNGETSYEFLEHNGFGLPIKRIASFTGPAGTLQTRTNHYRYYDGATVANSGNMLAEVTGPGGPNDVRATLKYSSSNSANNLLLPNFPLLTQFKDALNQTVTNSYNPDGTLFEIASATGEKVQIGYYPPVGHWSNPEFRNASYLKVITNLNTYDSLEFTWTNGQIHTIKDSRGLVTTNYWDGLLRLTGVAFPDGTTISNMYSRLDLFKSKDRLGNWTKAGYNSVGQMVLLTNALDQVTRFGYCLCGTVLNVTNALTNVVSFGYDYQHRRTNANIGTNFSLRFAFDTSDRLTTVTDGASRTTSYLYNNQGLLSAVTNAYGILWGALYDAEDRLAVMTNAFGMRVTNQFDLLGRVTNRVWFDSVSNQTSSERFVYNVKGLQFYTNRLAQGTSYDVDVAGRLLGVTNANAGAVRFQYAPAGDLLSMVDALSRTTTWQRDVFGRVTNKLDTLANSVFKLTYDAMGRVTNRWTPAKGNVTNTFDAIGQLTRTDYTNSRYVQFAYDAANQLTNFTEVNPAVFTGSRVTAFAYTDAGQLRSESGPWEGSAVTRQYSHGLLSALIVKWSATDFYPPMTNTHAYDSAGRLQSIVSPAGNFGYNYKGATRLVEQLTRSGSITTNRYDAEGRLLETVLRSTNGTLLDRHAYVYNPLGQRTNETRWSGNYRRYTYDAAGQLKTALGYESNNAARLNEQFQYQYDGAGNLTNRTSDNYVQQFTNDSRNQLSSVTRSGKLTFAGSVAQGSVSLVTVNSRTNSLYSDGTFAWRGFDLYNGTNHFVTVATGTNGLKATNVLSVSLPVTRTFLHDANGNLTNDGRFTYTYDEDDRLTGVSERAGQPGGWKVRWDYDALGRRIAELYGAWNASGVYQDLNLVEYTHAGRRAVREVTHNDSFAGGIAEKALNVWGPDLSGEWEGADGIGGLLARSGATGVFQHHADGGGNISTLVDGSGAVVGRYLYDPYGNTLGASGTQAGVNRYRFSSKEVHQLSGLYHYGFRDYAPDMQRWMSRDPLGEAGGINLYGFVRNSPINFIDPDGFQPVPVARQLPSSSWQNYRNFGGGGGSTVGFTFGRASELEPFMGRPMRDMPVAMREMIGRPRGFMPNTSMSAPGSSSGGQIGAHSGGSSFPLPTRPCPTYNSSGQGPYDRFLGSAAKGGVTLADDLAAAASRARNTVGPGSGGAYGTRVHTAFEAEVNGLGRGLQTEVSYLNGQVVPRGTPGSVRLDVVNGPLNAPSSIFDLKTGGATLTPGRIQQIQSHVPGGSGVPVFEVRP